MKHAEYEYRLDCITTGIAEIITKICGNDEMIASIIHYKTENRFYEFKKQILLNEVMKKVTKDENILFRIENVEYLHQSILRSCSVFIANSMDEMKKFSDAISVNLFHHRRYFLILDLSRINTGQNNSSSLNESNNENANDQSLKEMPKTVNFNSMVSNIANIFLLSPSLQTPVKPIQSQTRQSRANSPYNIEKVPSQTLNATKIFQYMWRRYILNANILTIDGDSPCAMSVTTFKPFSEHTCNNTSPVVVNYYENGSFVNSTYHFTKDKLNNFKRCPINVVTTNGSEPFFFISRDRNGKLVYTGRDVDIVEELARLLNFRIKYIILEDKGFLAENGTAGGMFLLLQNGTADLAINDLWLTMNRMKHFTATDPLLTDDLIFVIPPGTDFTPFEKLVYPIDLWVWILLAISFVIGYFSIFVIKTYPKNVQDFFFGKRVRNQYLNIWSAFFGVTFRRLPRTNFARYILMMFLMYSLVIRNVYQGSMYQFMQSKGRHKEIQTITELFSKEDFQFFVLPLNMEMFQQLDLLQNRSVQYC